MVEHKEVVHMAINIQQESASKHSSEMLVKMAQGFAKFKDDISPALEKLRPILVQISDSIIKNPNLRPTPAETSLKLR